MKGIEREGSKREWSYATFISQFYNLSVPMKWK